ncbi:MAG: carbohydrate kinase family protein [Bacillota bacterium]|nr:carbohydrate kinase family protein [Bacillota bacterium]
MKKIFVSGLINLETTCKIKSFPIPYSPIDYPFFGINTTVSGVGMNLTKALKTLGDDVFPLSIIGNDENADLVLRAFSDLGVNTEYIMKYAAQTAQSVILYDNDGKRRIYCDLKNLQDLSVNEIDVSAALERCDLVIACNINFSRSLLKAAKEKKIPIATDVHVFSDIHDEYNNDFLNAADILFLSDENIKGDPKKFLLSLLQEYQSKIIVLGQGSKGSLMIVREENTVYDIDAVFTRKVINTAGAGDSLFSSFLHYYLKGEAPIEALKRATLFASYKIGEAGAASGFVDEAKIEELYKQTAFNIKTDSLI